MPDLARRSALLAMLTGAGLGGLGCSLREPVPSFGYTLLDGVPRHSTGLRGKVVLVNFWATSCAVCVHEMPEIAATHQRFRGRGLEVLAVAVRSDAPAAVSNFAQARHLPFGVAIDNAGAIAAAFGDVDVTPTSLLLDRHGVVVWRHLGAPDFAALHGRLERLLAEGATASA